MRRCLARGFSSRASWCVTICVTKSFEGIKFRYNVRSDWLTSMLDQSTEAQRNGVTPPCYAPDFSLYKFISSQEYYSVWEGEGTKKIFLSGVGARNMSVFVKVGTCKEQQQQKKDMNVTPQKVTLAKSDNYDCKR